MKLGNLKNSGILVVDDEHFSRITVLRALKSIGVEKTHNASNGLEALSILENPENIINGVVLDFNMPVMHGLQLLKAIRIGHHGINKDTPVAMVTGHSEKQLVVLAMALDVNAFLVKPIEKSKLEEILHRILIEESFEAHLTDCYMGIEVDDSIVQLLRRPTLSLRNVVENKNPLPDDLRNRLETFRQEGRGIRCSLENLPENSLLINDLKSNNGHTFLYQGVLMTKSMIHRLKDLADLDFLIDEIWVMELGVNAQEDDASTEMPPDEENVNESDLSAKNIPEHSNAHSAFMTRKKQ
jgi:CheY-like chemotaxis protein